MADQSTALELIAFGILLADKDQRTDGIQDYFLCDGMADAVIELIEGKKGSACDNIRKVLGNYAGVCLSEGTPLPAILTKLRVDAASRRVKKLLRHANEFGSERLFAKIMEAAVIAERCMNGN